MKRTVNAIVYSVLFLFLGVSYAWSTFAARLKIDPQYLWENTAITFTVFMTCFCLGAFFAALLAKKMPVRLLVLSSGVLAFLGLFLSAFASSPSMLNLTYGVLLGLAIGITYNCVLSVAPRWFPDKTGVLNGALLMCFGAGSLVLGPVADMLFVAYGLKTTFIIFAFAFLAALAAGSFFVRPPKDGEVPAFKAGAGKQGYVEEGALDVGPVKMVSRPSFWIYAVWSIVFSAAGLALVGAAKPFALELGADERLAIFVPGIIGIFNGLGRLFFGGFFDRSGRKKTMLAVSIIGAVFAVLITATSMTQNVVLMVAALVACGLMYGGVPPTNANFTRSAFGKKNYPMNLSVINFSLLVASQVSIIVSAVRVPGDFYIGIGIIVALCSAVGIGCALILKKP